MALIDDLFPPSERTFFKRASDVLVRVVFQARFPRILRLESELPATFQEAVTKTFPLYERTLNLKVPDNVQVPPEVLQAIAAQGGTAAQSHQFLTEDRSATINLSPDQMAVALTRNYTTWEDYRGLLQLAIEALTQSYKVPFFLRIGLRYQDVIHRETLGLPLAENPWVTLINPQLIGNFPFRDFESNVTVANNQLSMALPDESGRVTLRHGLVNLAGKNGQAYGLDMDFSRQPKIEITDVFNRLEHFHDLAGRAFRWSLTEKLRNALGPTEIQLSGPQQAARA